MNGENSMEAYTLTRVKQTAIRNWLRDSGNSTWGSVTTQRGGREVQEGGDICTLMWTLLICVDVWQKSTNVVKQSPIN